MTKTKISVILRTIDEIEVSPGVFDYKYELIEDIPANLLNNLSFNHSRNSDIIPRENINKRYSFIMFNDDTDRVNRIHYVIERNIFYNVGSMEYFPPRVNIVPSGIAKGIALEDLGIKNGKD